MPTGLKTFSVFWFEERMPPPRHSRLLQAAQMLQKSIVRRKQYPSNPDEPDGKVILNNSVFESDRLRISTRDVILVINNQFFGVQGSRPAQENAKLILFSFRLASHANTLWRILRCFCTSLSICNPEWQ
jgi:hypothetical protein